MLYRVISDMHFQKMVSFYFSKPDFISFKFTVVMLLILLYDNIIGAKELKR